MSPFSPLTLGCFFLASSVSRPCQYFSLMRGLCLTFVLCLEQKPACIVVGVPFCFTSAKSPLTGVSPFSRFARCVCPSFSGVQFQVLSLEALQLFSSWPSKRKKCYTGLLDSLQVFISSVLGSESLRGLTKTLF